MARMSQTSLWQLVGRVHGAIYRASGGRLGARLAGIPMLLLTTIGRRSGHRRTLPLAYLPDGDDMAEHVDPDRRQKLLGGVAGDRARCSLPC